MKNFKKLFLFLTVIGLAFIALTCTTQNNTVQAARWHSGTPKVLRGKYLTKYGSRSNRRWTLVRVGKKTVTISASGMPVTYGIHARYKYLGKHRYSLKYYVKHTMQVPGRRHDKITIHKVGKRYRINNLDSHWFYKH